MFWNNPAGGLHYHLRALTNRRRWEPFRDGVQAFLEEWRPGRRTLAIVGPSAGYCVPLAALGGFERFVVFELDPFARFLFARRLARALPDRDVRWVREDAWVAPLRAQGHPPRELLGEDCALLFTNVLGQLPYMLAEREYPDFRRAWIAEVFPWLKDVPWASFHDRVSSSVAPCGTLPTHGRRLSDAEVRALYASSNGGAVVELCDHGSDELVPTGYAYRYLHWPLTSRMHHLIECVMGGRCVERQCALPELLAP